MVFVVSTFLSRHGYELEDWAFTCPLSGSVACVEAVLREQPKGCDDEDGDAVAEDGALQADRSDQESCDDQPSTPKLR